MQARAIAMARCDLPVPVPPISTALRCAARKAPLAKSRISASLTGVPEKSKVLDVLSQRQLGDGQLIFDRARLLLGNLGAEQIADNPRRLMPALDAGGHHLVVGRPH